MTDFVLYAFTDRWWDWERDGFASRTATLARLLGEHSRVGKVLVVDVPGSWAGALAGRGRPGSPAESRDGLAPFAEAGPLRRRTSSSLWRVGERTYVLDHTRLLPRERHEPAALVINTLLHDGALRRLLATTAESLGMTDIAELHCGPLTLQLAGAVGDSVRVYDAVDEWLAHPAFQRMRGPIERGYQRAVRSMDLVLAVTPALAERFEGGRPVVSVVRNGVGDEFSAASPVAVPGGMVDLPRPIIGYVGAMQERLDVEALRALARAMPEALVCLVGPVLSPSHVAPLHDEPNVRFVGPVPHGELHAYVRSFDVCVMPHFDTPLTRRMDPIKLYEYVAAARPTVCSGVLADDRFAGLVTFASDRGSFIEAVRAAASGELDIPREAALAFAAANSWVTRVDGLVDAVEGVAHGRHEEVRVAVPAADQGHAR